jgi:daunorubicin/doxorubicin transport system ATP-binding protein
MIETRGLVKLYGMHAALRGVTLEVPSGQVLTILGHNGSGKTTLVRLLATLARPTAGRGRIAGHDLIDGRDEVRRLVAVVGHRTHLYDDLTPRENLAFAEALAGRRADTGRIDAALAKMGLDGHSGTRVRALSSGLRRRVALARAMLREPRVLLLDEAFSGLDHDSTKRLEDYLHGFKAAGGAAVVVTHSLGRALAIADRVAILAGGRIAAEATRASLTEEALQRLYLGATDASA